jgi:hypothetical protein
MFTIASRFLYALTLIALVSGTGWAAGGLKSNPRHATGGVGIVLLAALQR